MIFLGLIRLFLNLIPTACCICHLNFVYKELWLNSIWLQSLMLHNSLKAFDVLNCIKLLINASGLTKPII